MQEVNSDEEADDENEWNTTRRMLTKKESSMGKLIAVENGTPTIEFNLPQLDNENEEPDLFQIADKILNNTE